MCEVAALLVCDPGYQTNYYFPEKDFFSKDFKKV